MSKTIMILLFWFSIIPSLASQLLGEEILIFPKMDAHPELAKRIQGWIVQLEQPNSKVATENLIKIGKIVHSYLHRTLVSSNNLPQKKKILEIIKQNPCNDCAAPLIKCLENNQEDPRIRGESAAALELFPNPEVMAKLPKYAFNRDVRIYQSAAYTLCQFSSKSAIPYLIQLLKHWDESVVRKAHLRLLEITKRDRAPLEFAAWQQWWADYQDIFEEAK